MIVPSLGATSVLSPDTIANLNKALENYDLSFSCIIFAGGVFNSDKGQIQSAAFMMNRWWKCQYRGEAQTIIEYLSKTTRQNIIESIRRLKENGYKIADCDIVVVSEYWHLKGIAYLFRRLYGINVNCIASDFKLGIVGIIGRIARLILYRIDPQGDGWLTRHVAGKRD